MSGYTLSAVSQQSTRHTHVARTLEQIEAQFDYHVIFVTKDLSDLACNPSEVLVSDKLQSAGRPAYFFMTSIFTFCMSTFWLNSSGNLVCARSFWSTEAAILAESTLASCAEGNVSVGIQVGIEEARAQRNIFQ